MYYSESIFLYSSFFMCDSSVLLYIVVVHSFLSIHNLLIHPIPLLRDIVILSLGPLSTASASLVDFKNPPVLIHAFTPTSSAAWCCLVLPNPEPHIGESCSAERLLLCSPTVDLGFSFLGSAEFLPTWLSAFQPLKMFLQCLFSH